jgi:site-specific recombinase XerD
MAINEVIKKITIAGLDTKGLYLKDSNNLFNVQEIGKVELKKLDNQPLNIVVKLFYKSKTIKRTLNYNHMSGLNAVKKAIIKRIELKEELEETGQLKRKEFKSLNDLFIDYMELKRDSLSSKNIYSSKKFFDKWISPKIGDMAINKIHTTDIQNIVNKILRQGLKPRTAQTVKQILRPLFNYAIDMNILDINPAIKVTLPSFDNTVDFQLSEEKRKKLYECIQSYKIEKYKGIMLFLYFGRRLNEALTLRWENIYFEQNTYVIEDKYSKIRRRQEYPLLEPLKEFLEAFGIQKYGFIFKGEKTEHVTAHTFRSHWKALLKSAGIEKMRIHDTRHLIGNTMVNRGTSLEAIGKVLGHSSNAVTKRYAKTSLNTANDVLSDYLK